MKSGRIKLKKPEWDDIKFIQWLWSDPETMNQVGGPIILDDQKAELWFERMISPGSYTDCYRLILDQDSIPVGEISYHRLDPKTMTAEFNIKIAKEFRRQGLSKDAMILFLDHFFNKSRGEVLIDKVALINDIGIRTLLNFGFKYDPLVKDVFVLKITKEQFNVLYQNMQYKWSS